MPTVWLSSTRTTALALPMARLCRWKAEVQRKIRPLADISSIVDCGLITHMYGLDKGTGSADGSAHDVSGPQVTENDLSVSSQGVGLIA